MQTFESSLTGNSALRAINEGEPMSTNTGSLAKMQAADGVATVQDVPDSTGTDERGRLTLTIDATRHVVRAKVIEANMLRTHGDLVEALTDAYDQAEIARAEASLAKSGSLHGWEDLPDVAQTRAKTSAAPPREMSRQAVRARRDARPDRAPARSTGHSTNGFLAITRNRRGSIVSVVVDAEWLSGAQEQHLSHAIIQAMDTETERAQR